jgi:hypothetical protein
MDGSGCNDNLALVVGQSSQCGLQHQLYRDPAKETNKFAILISAADTADSPMTFCYL